MPALLLNTTAPLANPRPCSTSRPSRHRLRCRASSTTGGRVGSSWATDYDLYELLGVEPSSSHADIKAAYRALQKRCHPDIAGNATNGDAGPGPGPSAHDMAVVLNEVYALLSDPAQRQAYDREHARRSEFQGYTGRPLYSSWRGGDAETRAVFVDEVACVGCLKCALHAGCTFAIESVHGRARVVAQWADPEDRIADAVQTCPVDCISYVDRSDLAALEFLMSKLPRRRVRVSEANAAGSPDIFAEVAKFKARFDKMESSKSATRKSEESEATWQSRSSAVQTLMSMSNWWYWRPFRAPAGAATAAVPAPLRLLPPPSSPPPSSAVADPVTERLKEAAARRKAEGATASAVYARERDEYWTPQLNLPSAARFPSPDAQSAAPPPRSRSVRRPSGGERAPARRASIDLTVPLLMAIVAAGIAGYNREEMAGGAIEDHIGGAAALGVVNSSELQVILAGVTWFVIGAAVAGVIQVVLGRRDQ